MNGHYCPEHWPYRPGTSCELHDVSAPVHLHIIEGSESEYCTYDTTIPEYLDMHDGRDYLSMLDFSLHDTIEHSECMTVSDFGILDDTDHPECLTVDDPRVLILSDGESLHVETSDSSSWRELHDAGSPEC